MRKKVLPIFIFLFIFNLSFTRTFDSKKLYNKLNLKDKITFKVFYDALLGRSRVINGKKHLKFSNDLLMIIDYSKPSYKRRLLLLDLRKQKVLYYTYAKHGSRSGLVTPKDFSNVPDSYKTSLGFYRAAEPYYGKFGYSLRLDGLEKGINDNARRRAIVFHGEPDITPELLKKYGRLTRSLGCPVVSSKISTDIINRIKGGTLIYMNGNDNSYKLLSSIL